MSRYLGTTKNRGPDACRCCQLLSAPAKLGDQHRLSHFLNVHNSDIHTNHVLVRLKKLVYLNGALAAWPCGSKAINLSMLLE